MIALMVVVTDERIDLRFKVSGQEVVFQQDAVLQRLMPALDLSLRLGMIRRAARMLHAFVGKILSQIARDVTRPVVKLLHFV